MLDFSSISGTLSSLKGCASQVFVITSLFSISSVSDKTQFLSESIQPGLSPALQHPIAYREIPWAASTFSKTWFAELHNSKSKDPLACRDLSVYSSASSVASFAFSIAEQTPQLSIVDVGVEIGCGKSEKYYSIGKIRPSGSSLRNFVVSLSKIPSADLKKVRGLVLSSRGGKIRVGNVQVGCGNKTVKKRTPHRRKRKSTLTQRATCPANTVIQDFSTDSQLNTNLLGGYSDTDGTGTVTVSNGIATWSPTTSSTTNAYWYTTLYDGAAASSAQCLDLQSYGSKAAVSITISKTTSSAAALTVAVNVGCGSSTFKSLEKINLAAGAVSSQTYTIDILPGLASAADLSSINAILLAAYGADVPTGSVFTIDDIQITCSDASIPTSPSPTAPSCSISPLAIQDFSSSAQINTNLLSGYSDTDGTGTVSVSSGVATWSPTTSSTASAYWYTELFSDSAATDAQCTNLQSYGATAAVSAFRTLGTISLPAGAVVPQVYNVNILPGLASSSELASIKAILLIAYSTDVPTGSVFTVDDIQISCDGTTSPSPITSPTSSPVVSASPSPVAPGQLCTAPGGEVYERIPGTRPILAERCRLPGQFAFTFDDGPKLYEPELLTKLNNYGVKVTFFFNSNNWVNITTEPYRSWVKSAFDAGHQIASHTATHPYLTSLTSAQILSELKQVEDAFFSIFGKKPAVMRPPFGDFNDAVLQTVEAAGYNSAAIWNVDTQDWQHNNVTQSMAYVKDAIETKCPTPGTASILELSHSTTSSSVDLVDAMIPYVLSRGYTFVTVAECLGLDFSLVSGTFTCAANAVSVTSLFTIPSVQSRLNYLPEEILPGLSPSLGNPVAYRQIPWTCSELSNTWFAELHGTESKNPQACRDLTPFSTGSTVASFAFSLAEETPRLSIVDVSLEIGCGKSEKVYSIGKIRPTGSAMKTYTVSLDKVPKDDLKRVRGLVLSSKEGRIRVGNVQVVCGAKNQRVLESRNVRKHRFLRRACPSNLLVHDFSTNSLYNLIGGYSDTDGTGTFTIASGIGTWTPNPTASQSAYWYSNLYGDSAASGSQCLNLQSYGSSAAISVKVGKTTTAGATLIVAVNLGCSSNTYTQIGTISMPSGVVATRVYSLSLSAGVSTAQLATVNSILLVADATVPAGSTFTIDDLQITCSETSSTTTTIAKSTTSSTKTNLSTTIAVSTSTTSKSTTGSITTSTTIPLTTITSTTTKLTTSSTSTTSLSTTTPFTTTTTISSTNNPLTTTLSTTIPVSTTSKSTTTSTSTTVPTSNTSTTTTTMASTTTTSKPTSTTTSTTTSTRTSTVTTSTPSCGVSPLSIQDFSSSSQLNTNLLNGYSDTDGTGTISIASGVATWSPVTSSTSSAYWYTELFSGSAASGSQCSNLQVYGSTAAVSVKLGKSTSSAATITVGVDVGCGSTKSFQTLGKISLAAGVVAPKVYNINILPGLASSSDISSIKAVLLIAYSTDVPTGSVFSLDDVQINCAGTIQSPTVAPSPTTTVITSPTSTANLCTAPGGSVYERIPGTRPIIAESCRQPGQFAFTFDDGPKLYEPQLLTKLASYGVKVTFFFNSNNWVNITTEPYRSWVKSAYDAGHQIASHTATHPYLTSLTSAQILSELKQVEDSFFSIFGKKPAVMRPPYGDYNNAVMQTIESAGYNSAAIWNVDTQDWQHNNVTQSMAYVKDAIETKCPIPGSASILELSHSTTSSSVDLVDAMIPYVRSRGYTFVTVAECLVSLVLHVRGKNN
ncbi:Carbohydrate esterase 4 protein [Nowakowskiella sp. JEL0407]|nr:Carbohydrate esterase 4 protein [Nowakowskiella sp. JEL0407]